MQKVILFPNDNNSVSFCYPANCSISVQEIARKDVPAGKPYLIVNAEDLPQDHMFFDAFEADFSNPDGYGIGQDAWFSEQATMKGNV